MLDYLLAADLLLLTAAQVVLVWHCFKAGPKAALFAGFITERAEHLSDTLADYGAILEDIADALDGGSGGGPSIPSIPSAGGSIGEILTTALLSRAMSAATDGPPQSEGEIRIGEIPTPNEIGNEPVEHR
jgi:hypothetical protein